jgi:3-hydroxyisobutyrate dehydrogenase-like beta-hydroxyacid dehydrogenase
MERKIGFIGLGAMGLPIATRLLEAGHTLRLYNRTPEKAEALVSRGAERGSSPAEVVVPGGLVFTMLADDEAVERVTAGPNGILDRLGEGGVHVSLSTIAPELARRLADAHARRGARYVAAPVFGRPEAAAAGKLWIVLAGDAEGKERIADILPAFSLGVYDFGSDPGAANTVKLAGNFLIAAAMQAMAESFTLAEKQGIDRVRMAKLLSETLFDCPVYRNYGQAVAAHKFQPAGFRLPLGLKDIRLVLQTAEQARVPMPSAHILHQGLLAVLASGGEDLDWSALALTVSRNAGLGG